MDNNDLLNYTKTTITQAQLHLQYLREMTDICEGVDGISAKLNNDSLLEETAQVLQFNSLTTIAKIDLSIILKNLLSAEFQWEKLYFLRQAHLTIHETLATYNNHNKNLRIMAIRQPGLNEDYIVLQDELKQFRKKAVAANTNEIRNCTAHIDQDFKKYYDTLLKVDASKTLELTADFIRILDKLFLFSHKCLEADALSTPDLEQLEKKMTEFREKLLELSEIIDGKNKQR